MSGISPGRWFLIALFGSVALSSLASGQMVRWAAGQAVEEVPCARAKAEVAAMTTERDRLITVKAEILAKREAILGPPAAFPAGQIGRDHDAALAAATKLLTAAGYRVLEPDCDEYPCLLPLIWPAKDGTPEPEVVLAEVANTLDYAGERYRSVEGEVVCLVGIHSVAMIMGLSAQGRRRLDWRREVLEERLGWELRL